MNDSKPNITLPVADNQAYTILGAISTPFNILTLIVFLSDRSLLKKSSIMVGLTLGNLFLGFFLLANGSYRMARLTDLTKQATFEYCLSIILPILYPLAFCNEAAFLCLGGIERLLAIKAPHWFRKYWTDRNSWYVTAGVLISILAIMITGLVWPSTDRSKPTIICPLTVLFGTKFFLFLCAFAATGGAMSAILTTTALIAGLKHIHTLPLASGEVGRVRKQVQLTKSMATLSLFDVALVAIPNVFTFLGSIGFVFPWWIRPNNTSYTHGINVTMAFFAFLAFHRQFRKAAFKLCRIDKIKSSWAKISGKVVVVPVNQVELQTRSKATEDQSRQPQMQSQGRRQTVQTSNLRMSNDKVE